MKTVDCCSSTGVGADAAENAAEAIGAGPQNGAAPLDDPGRGCRKCGGASRAVTRRTVLLMLRQELLDEVGGDEYRFCPDPDCRVVYFAEDGGRHFMTEDLRVRVGLKERDGEIPLCYCFGFDESDARAEIASTGRSSIPQRIAALIRQGMCACPERNPSGACCLGEVNKAVRHLTAEMSQSEQFV